METLLRLGVRVLVMYLTLSLYLAYGREGSLRSPPPASVPSAVEAGTQRNVEAATVSVTSMLVPQKARFAYERAERALSNNELEEAEEELNSALGIYPNSAVASCLMGTLHEERLQLELRRLTETAALAGPSTFLIQAINEREQELRQITDKLLSTGPESIDSRLAEIRLFVIKKLSDIRELLARHETADPVAVRTELRKHVSEIRMTPQPGARRPHYLAEGAWDLVGKETGPHHEAAPLSIRMVAGADLNRRPLGYAI
jgi:hypothetical protein